VGIIQVIQGAAGNIDFREKIKVSIPTRCRSDVRVFWNKIALVSRAARYQQPGNEIDEKSIHTE
jgi:hypothetical protein